MTTRPAMKMSPAPSKCVLPSASSILPLLDLPRPKQDILGVSGPVLSDPPPAIKEQKERERSEEVLEEKRV